MKKQRCIWCTRTQPEVTFEKDAHIVPQSLGGKRICKNVCDACNSHFGNKKAGVPSVEEAIKEAFSITRDMILHAQDKIGKNKKKKWHSSIFFKVDFKRRSITVKPAYRLRLGFQEMMLRQVSRGLYKMLLETIEEDTGTALDSRYDFIRAFARYDLGEYPVYYYLRRYAVVLFPSKWVDHPEVRISEPKMKYLVSTDSFIEFEFLGHVVGLVKSNQAFLMQDEYLMKSRDAKIEFFHGFVFVKYFNDFDLSLNIFDDNGGYERWLLNQYGKRLWVFKP